MFNCEQKPVCPRVYDICMLPPQLHSSDEEIEERFRTLFERDMTAQERRCFLLSMTEERPKAEPRNPIDGNLVFRAESAEGSAR